MKHTPGPWYFDADDKLNPDRAYGIVRDLGKTAAEEIGVDYATEVIAEVCSAEGETALHDARLIASAPELYEACESALSQLDECLQELIDLGGNLQVVENTTEVMSWIRAAIAKAEGRE